MRDWGLQAMLAGMVLSGIPALAQDEIQWLDRYSDAIREAKRTQKPIFLEFRCEP
jgi:hypothetical protein